MATAAAFPFSSLSGVSRNSSANVLRPLPSSSCSWRRDNLANLKLYQGRKNGRNLITSCKAEKFTVTAAAVVKPAQLENLSGVVTDAAVPEGHKGLHGFLYGEGDADIHSGSSANERFAARAGEDDGSSILGFDHYVSARETSKLSGVYAIYNSAREAQYIGYSRNVVLSLKSHRSRVGAEKCTYVRVKLFAMASIVSRAKLEEERQHWIDQEERMPPGNSIERNAWERNGDISSSLQLMTEEERSEYEEKKLKMRKAMGENLHDDVDGEDDDSRIRRLKLLSATEGDDWSGVIDGQTEQTVEFVSPNGYSPDGQVRQPVEPVTPNGVASIAVVQPHSRDTQSPIVSPFDKDENNGRLDCNDLYELNMENVDLVLNEVRPYLISDGGNVEVVSVIDGIVALRLQGACGTCPSSTVTMKMGIERVLNEKFGPALKGVVQIDQQNIGATVMGVNSHLEMLRPAIHNYGGFVEVLSVETCKGLAVLKYKGPSPIGMGIQAAIKDKFPDIREVVLVNQDK